MSDKREIRDALRLSELPDDEFMRLVEAVGDEEVITGVPPVADEGYTPDDIREELQEAWIVRRAGDQ